MRSSMAVLTGWYVAMGILMTEGTLEFSVLGRTCGQ